MPSIVNRPTSSASTSSVVIARRHRPSSGVVVASGFALLLQLDVVHSHTTAISCRSDGRPSRWCSNNNASYNAMHSNDQHTSLHSRCHMIFLPHFRIRPLRAATMPPKRTGVQQRWKQHRQQQSSGETSKFLHRLWARNRLSSIEVGDGARAGAADDVRCDTLDSWRKIGSKQTTRSNALRDLGRRLEKACCFTRGTPHPLLP
eukprot:9486279-Pyramimonas_sp.AAC.2